MKDCTEEEEDPSRVFTLELNQTNLREIPKSILQYGNLKSLDLSCNMITGIKERDLATLKELRELKVYANQLQRISALQKLTKLETLQLQFNQITAVGVSLKNNRNLKFLRLDGNKITSLKADELCTLSQLTYIDVSSNSLVNIDCFNVLASLEELHCTHNNISKIPQLRSLRKLRFVDLSNNKLSEISGLKGLPSLTVIHLNQNCLHDLKSLGPLTSLQDLHIKGNKISDTKHLVDQFPNMEILDVSDNAIDSIVSVEHLLNLDALRELSIEENDIVTSSPQMKQRVLKLICDKIDLDILDGHSVAKVPKRNASHIMRPLSASQGLSTRLLESQIYSEDFEVLELKGKISNTFLSIQEILETLPKEPPTWNFQSSPGSTESRPESTDSGIQHSKNQNKRHQSAKGPNRSRKQDRKLVKSAGDHKRHERQIAGDDSRPSSRCSRRTRIEDAKKFAADNF